MKMTLVRRFMLTCTTIVVICCVVTGVAVFCMVRTQQAVVGLNEHSVPGVFWAGRLSAIAKDQRTYVLLHLNSANPSEMADLESKVEQANAGLAEGRSKYPVTSKEDSVQLESMASAQRQWMDAWYKIRDFSREGKKTEAWEVYNSELMRATLSRRKADDYLSSTSREQGFRTAAQALAMAHRAIPLVLAFALLAIVASLLLSFWMARHLKVRLKALTKAADCIAKGDVTVDVEIAGDEEVQELSRSFADTVAYLQQMAAISEQIAAGDLATRVHPRCEHDALSKAFARMVEGLTVLVRGVRDSAVQVASASSQMAAAAGTQAVVKSMERMRDIVQRYTSSSTELAASAGQMSQMSGNLLRLMDNFQLNDAEPAPKANARISATVRSAPPRALVGAGRRG